MKEGFQWDTERSPQKIHNFNVKLIILIQAVHVKMEIDHFWPYLRQILMDFAQIWFI